VVSTTTSLFDTGVLDIIELDFESNNDIDLRFISVGTGLAIKHAERGDADMILVHAPSKELAFMEGGYGVLRKIVAYNFFSIICSSEDPAGIDELPPLEALSEIVEAGRSGKAIWVSRGDDSGTHTKEKQLWESAGFNLNAIRDENWYREAGTGMGKTLQIAEELQAYALTDMGTYLKYYNDGLITSVVLVGAGEELLNVYSSITVNPNVNPDTNIDASIKFIEYLVSKKGQNLIGQFGIDIYDVNLFNPAVDLLKTRSDSKTVEWIENFAYFDGSECPVSYRAGETDLYR
jgi:tungstate transport system substrate-binding protein